jgi:hypothetical protein
VETIMATDAPITGAPTRATPLSDFARICGVHCPNADTLEQIGRVFLEAAAELRAQERH